MLADEKAYLSGSNQYEVGAKILLFTNLLNNLPGATAGFHASINCKSGKDRTGIMDAVAKTHEIMRAQNNGKYYSTDSITGDVEEQFKETFINVLENGGGLDITEVNTGVRGYKVGKEAKLFGMTDADWKEITGLATFASS